MFVSESAEETHEFVGLNSLLFVGLVGICLFLSQTLKKFKVYYLHGSGASMLFGLLIGGLITLAGKTESEYVTFKPDVFFFLLLPPIIFEAGFTLKRRNFFKNMPTILLFAVLGTLVSALVIGFGLYGLAKLSIVPIDSKSPLEALLFGSLISAVDPVATLSILGSREINADPMLYSLVFGESVLNDAVSIVLFKTFEGYAETTTALSDAKIQSIIGFFFEVSICSLLIGVFIALLCSFILKHANLKSSPSLEFTMITLTAYGTYCVAEILQMSGIVSLFFCGIIMAHYAMYNVSLATKTAAYTTYKSFAMLAETFVFAYLGIFAGISFGRREEYQSFLMILFSLLLCFVSRALNIFTFSFIANIRRKRRIPFRMQVAIQFAGLRGAIAFALALNVPRILNNSKSYVISTTLTIVFFTTLVCGGLTAHILSLLGLRNRASTEADNNRNDKNSLRNTQPLKSGDNQNVRRASYSIPPQNNTADQPLVEETGEERLTRFHLFWRSFDLRYLKKWFGGCTEPEYHINGSIVDVDGDEFIVNLPTTQIINSELADLHLREEPDLISHHRSTDEGYSSLKFDFSGIEHEKNETLNVDSTSRNIDFDDNKDGI